MEQPDGLPESGERLDFVPWSAYESARVPQWAPWLSVLAVVVIAGVAVFFLGRGGGSPGRVAPITLITEQTLPPPSSTSTAPLSEADLRASPPHSESAVGAAAESFVFGYFTIDPQRSSGPAADLAASLGTTPDRASYVEWLSAEDVTEIAPDVYHVSVRFRLVLLGNEPERIDDALVQVAVQAVDGRLAVLGPPRLLEMEPTQLIESDVVSDEAEVIAGPGGIPVLAQP